MAAGGLALGRRDDDPAWAYRVTEAEVEMLARSCALDLGDPRQAFAQNTGIDFARPRYRPRRLPGGNSIPASPSRKPVTSSSSHDSESGGREPG